MKNFFLFFLIFFFFFNIKFSFTEEVTSAKYFIGKQYKIKGKWYYPKNNLDYKEVGIASISKNKKTKKTVNGEIFSNKEIVAKHRSLALPTIVRVTNLNNGYSINVRINDRGPKNNFRIIELSKKTAKYLKIKDLGLVEVKVIPDLTMQEQNKVNNSNSLSDNIDNLEENIALGKETVETEDLMDNKKEIKKKNKKYYKSPDKSVKLKINFRKINIKPFYLRAEITKFKKFKNASNLKNKLKPIYDKILISLSLINGQKYYKVTTIPINSLEEAEKILKVTYKNGLNNTKLFIETRKK